MVYVPLLLLLPARAYDLAGLAGRYPRTKTVLAQSRFSFLLNYGLRHFRQFGILRQQIISISSPD